jgi:hypothetical protein
LNNPIRHLLAFALFLLFSNSGAMAQSMELLGSTVSEPRIEQSIIRIGKGEGRYQSIQLQVERNDAQIIDIRAIYGNNDVESFQVREVFRAGSTSRRIALKGGERFLKEVVVTYRALGPVQINVFGEPAPVARWVELGCKTVGFLVDRDVIRLARQDGQFKSIRLRVIGNRIEVFDLRVVYANGSPDDIRVRAVIPDRGQTGPLDLRGDRRALDRIEMIYRSQPSMRGEAVICVDGLQTSR